MRSKKVLYCIWRGQKGLEINNTVRVSGVMLSCGVANIASDRIVSTVGRISNQKLEVSYLAGSYQCITASVRNIHYSSDDKCTAPLRNVAQNRGLNVVRT